MKTVEQEYGMTIWKSIRKQIQEKTNMNSWEIDPIVDISEIFNTKKTETVLNIMKNINDDLKKEHGIEIKKNLYNKKTSNFQHLSDIWDYFITEIELLKNTKSLIKNEPVQIIPFPAK